jgi:hypothetical protein
MMMGRYGAKWTAGISPNAAWIFDLKNVTDEEILHGFKMDRDDKRDGKGWPPSSKEFCALCKIRKAPQVRLNKQFTKERSKESDQLMRNLKAGFK